MTQMTKTTTKRASGRRPRAIRGADLLSGLDLIRAALQAA